ALEAAGPRPWDQQAFPADDWDLWLRLTGEHGFAFVPQVVLRYRRHTAQATGQASARLRAADGYVRAKFLASCTSETDRALMTAGARFHEARLSALRRRWAIE